MDKRYPRSQAGAITPAAVAGRDLHEHWLACNHRDEETSMTITTIAITPMLISGSVLQRAFGFRLPLPPINPHTMTSCGSALG